MESGEPKLVIYHQESKEPGELEQSFFGIHGNGLLGWNGGGHAKTKRELSTKVCRVLRQNPELESITNGIPFVDIPHATFLEVTYESGHINRYRPLQEEEIPERLKRYIGKK